MRSCMQPEMLAFPPPPDPLDVMWAHHVNGEAAQEKTYNPASQRNPASRNIAAMLPRAHNNQLGYVNPREARGRPPHPAKSLSGRTRRSGDRR